MRNYNEFEMKLAFHAAPALLGIKSANMLSLSRNEFDINENINRFNERADIKGIKIRTLCECGRKALMLVYNVKRLEKRLSDKSIREFLKDYGYDEKFTMDECIARLSERIEGCGNFPHEVGVFLDYIVYEYPTVTSPLI